MNRPLATRIAAGLCGLFGVGSAGACPVDAPAIHGQTPAPALEHLLPLLDACLRSAPYFRQLGAAYLAAGQPDAAADAFERALLLEPDHPGTQLDYADALLRMGSHASATPLLQQLLARPDLPTHLRPVLQAKLEALTQPPQRWLHRWVVGAAAVVDDNLNNAPLSSTLTLTLPQGVVHLPVSPDFRPRAGAALLGQWQWTAVRPDGPALWAVQADFRYRHHAQAAHRYGQAELAAGWLQAPDAPRQWLLRGSVTALQWGGQALYQAARTAVQQQWRLDNACRAGLGGEAEWRHYPGSTTADGTYRGIAVQWQCTHQNYGWQVQVRAGGDYPHNPTRAGGRYHQQELRTAWNQTSGAWRWSLEYQLAAQQDAAGYSPLLANGQQRHQRRHAVALELSTPLAGPASGWRGYVALDISRQYSNLQPFATARRAISVGVRREWE